MVYASSFIVLHSKGSSQQRFFIAKPYTDILANGVRKENGKQCGQHF